MILITHDLGVVAEIADKVMVMYGGRTVEYGPVDEVYYNAHHPYTWGLLGSLPRLDLAEKTRLTPIKGQPPNLLAAAVRLPVLRPLRLRAAGMPRHLAASSRSSVPSTACTARSRRPSASSCALSCPASRQQVA